MSGYSPILELGDDPLTPREAVEYWLDLALTTGANKQDFNMSEAVTGILTALASGSGDHAELARLADDLRKFEHHAVGSLKIGMDEVRRIIAACDAHAALLAEIAALREQHEADMAEMARAWLQRHLLALTEAERKLDEAVGLQLPDISTDGPNEIDDHRYWLARQLLDSKLTADEAYSIVRHFPGISKEAERG